MVLETAVSVAVDFTEVVLADSEAMELAASAVAFVQVEVISADQGFGGSYSSKGEDLHAGGYCQL